MQIKRLLDILATDSATDIIVLMGDLNEWFPWGRPLHWLRDYFDKISSPASFPACCPVLSLDRILIRPYTSMASIETHKSSLARTASDHLPLMAVLE
jgi:endonuclease/exonuclease/phosphatase family metal-dependent hydrolase